MAIGICYVVAVAKYFYENEISAKDRMVSAGVGCGVSPTHRC